MANNSLSSSPVTRKTKRSTVAGKTAAAKSAPTVSLEDVARRAYAIYLEEGRPDGRHLDHWTRAESELRAS